MDIGFFAAFIGGALALLSPCGALLLPAFFASAVGGRLRQMGHGVVFGLGLALVLVPLGVGASLVGALFVQYRGWVVAAAAAVMVAFGLLTLFGIGFDPARILPGATQLQARAATSIGIVKTLLLGAASGVAGFCAGPILGAVLTLAAAQGNKAGAGILLCFYAIGMVTPLVILTWAWQRLSARTITRIRGRSFTWAGRNWHSTSVITGIVLIALGLLFWFTNGLITLPELIPTQAQAWLQARAAGLANPWVDTAVIILVALAIILAWYRASKLRGAHGPETREES